MTNDWPTKNQDLHAAATIMNRYQELNDGEPLGFLEIVMKKDNQIEVTMPAWVQELSKYFLEQYGHEHGHAITSKVLTKFLLQNETIH